MKFKFYILIFCITAFFGRAQKITLAWDGYKEMDYGTEKLTYPSFSNHGYQVDANSIFATVTVKTSNQIKLEQFDWQELPAKDVKDLKINAFPSPPTSSINYYFSETDNAESASIKVETIKVEKNKIFKLVSFNITQTNKTISSLYKNGSNRYGSNQNPLKSGLFYKIKVNKSGIFKITKQFLQQNGINPSNFNPKNFRIYGNGGIMLPEFNQDNKYDALQEDAIQVIGEEDGVWNDNDYALFYAQGPNGYNLFDFSNGNGNKRVDYRGDKSNNFVNIYDDYSYYFINFDIGPGKRVQTVDNSLPTDLITRYDDYQVINEEKFNLEKLGRIWVGDVIPTTREIVFTTKSPMQADDPIKFRTRVIAYGAQNSKIDINFNGDILPSNIFSNDTSYVPVLYTKTMYDQNVNTLKFNYARNISTSPNARFYFDYAEVQYKEDLSFNNSQMNFRAFDITEGTGELYGFSIANAAGIDQVWDVSDLTNAKKVVNKNAQNTLFNFGYIAGSTFFNNEFAAFKNSAAFEPTFVEKINNQDLASLTNVDYLIIPQPSFFPQAQRVAAYHQTNND